jgi:hypothetical protein
MKSKSEIIKLAVSLSRTHAEKSKYAAIIDFTRDADTHRFFLVDINKEQIEYSWYTSHGSGSGPRERVEEFSNISNSHKSSKGLMKTADVYYGKYGRSLRLKGLEKGVNSNVMNRAIVIHRSDYVSQPYMKVNKYPGRSHGCITLDPKKADEIIAKLGTGSVVYVIG